MDKYLDYEANRHGKKSRRLLCLFRMAHAGGGYKKGILPVPIMV